MKFTNLFQDPESDSPAPYADTFVLDGGGMDVSYGGETVAHVSFEDVDPFELAYHAMPDDWEPHEEWDAEDEVLLPITSEELLENGIYKMLNALAALKGWQRS